jgi:integrase
MASLLRDKISKSYKVKFWYGGKQFKWSLRHSNKTLANETLATVERTLRDLEEGRLVMPEGADVIEFVKTDGGRTQKAAAPEKPLTIGELFKQYPLKLTPGAKKGNSLGTNKTHGKNLVRVLGADCTLLALTKPGALQGYVAERAKKVEGETIKKEISTLGTVWRWARNNGLTKTDFPADLKSRLDLPKGHDKAEFQTWKQIEEKIQRGGMTEEEQQGMWDCLYLDKRQVEEVLEFVRKHAANSWLYPAILFVAHTGARRSEMLRSEVADFDFDKEIVWVRDYKRKKKLSRRDVPMTPKLKEVFQRYFSRGHKGQLAICIEPERTAAVIAERGVEGYVTYMGKPVDQAFNDVFKDSKWKVLHGYHVFRHSLISYMASESIDQRLIDGIVGHTTEAMRARYRHIFPHDKQAVMAKLFPQPASDTAGSS